MSASLAYLDDQVRTITAHCLEHPSLSESEDKEIRAQSLKSIAGFHLHDQAHEDKLRVARLESRRALLRTFHQHRDEAQEKCAELGVTPLAVVPLTAWERLCARAALIRLAPDGEGLVPLHGPFFDGFKSEREVEYYVKKNGYLAFVKELFPNNRVSTRDYSRQQYLRGTLVLPQPPAEVAEVLLKVQALTLKVATVAEAIGFKETPGQLWKHQQALREEEIRYQERLREEEIRYQEWLRKDPIVYTEHGTAAAILAQFGEFPAENRVIDEVLGSEPLVDRAADVSVTGSTYYAPPPPPPMVGPYPPMGLYSPEIHRAMAQARISLLGSMLGASSSNFSRSGS